METVVGPMGRGLEVRERGSKVSVEKLVELSLETWRIGPRRWIVRRDLGRCGGEW